MSVDKNEVPTSVDETRVRDYGEIERVGEVVDKLIQFRRSREWLDENRAAYSGKWVALDGDSLIIADADAKAVFAAVRGRSRPAMVKRIEYEEIHMGGW